MPKKKWSGNNGKRQNYVSFETSKFLKFWNLKAEKFYY